MIARRALLALFGVALLMLPSLGRAAVYSYPSSWYWSTVENPLEVFSSGAAAYVGTSNADYNAFLASGHVVGKLHDGQLAAVLVGAALNAAALAVNPTVWTGVPPLLEFETALESGVTITSTGTPAVNGTYDTAEGSSFSFLNELNAFASQDRKS